MVIHCRSGAIARISPSAGLALALLVFATAEQVAAQRQPGTVDVRVTEFDSEEPIFQAQATLSGFARGTFTHRGFTDGGGRITFSSVERGSYILEVSKMGYQAIQQAIDVGPGANVFAPVRLHRQLGSLPGEAPAKSVSAGALAVPSGARREFETGVTKLKEDPAKSVAHFRKAIDQYPQYAEAYAMLGVAQMRMKQDQDAMRSLSRAIELDPKLRLARTSMGELLMEQKQFTRAETELLESFRLDNQAWDTAFHLARCYYNMSKLDQALEYARRAQSLPNAPATTHLLLADIYLRQNEPSSGLKELEEFAKADPRSPFMPRVQEKITQLRKVRQK